MIYEIKQSSQFKRDFKTCLKRGLDYLKFAEVVDLLRNGSTLPIKYKDHPLQDTKNYKNCRELHISPDWLLVYKYSRDYLILYLIRTGTHSDLFD